MHYERYEITKGETSMTYEFVSQGPRGDVPKLVVYSKTRLLGIFNLGFGDKIREGDFDDNVVTNNGDTLKVMATVAVTLYYFTDRFPNAKVFVEGSTKTRTRLYRMAITNNLEVINADFEVYGLKNDAWEAFTAGIDDEAFLVIRKK
jgi:hypothetical protein